MPIAPSAVLHARAEEPVVARVVPCNEIAPPRSPARREKVFVSRLTRTGWLFVGLIVISCVMIAAQAIVSYMDHQETTTAVLLLVDVLLLGGTGLLLASQMAQRITITPTAIHYENRRHRVTMPWREAREFKRPVDSQRYFRFATISDGRHEIRFNSLVLQDFDLLCNLVAVARKRHVVERGNCHHI
jgi:hypothetical protein